MNAASLVQRVAGISGALAVAAGAYGAHGRSPFGSIVFYLADGSRHATQKHYTTGHLTGRT